MEIRRKTTDVAQIDKKVSLGVIRTPLKLAARGREDFDRQRRKRLVRQVVKKVTKFLWTIG